MNAERIQLSLISHTNVGKTTLARTLLRQDVGEVLDRAHVTETSEAFPLVETSGARLVLWDTPGFGDSARLVRRLRGQANPLGWLLSQVWDRLADRPLWSSQQAARTVRDSTDLVLYLVSASEDPEDAGYVRHELDLLTWIGRPVLLLLNQTGETAPGSAAAGQLEERWRRYARDWPIVRDVLSLDAFTRCWVEEGRLLEAVTEHLPEERRPTMGRLVEAWNQRNLRTFRSATRRLAEYLAGAACQRRALPGERPSPAERRRAMKDLAEQLDSQTRSLMDDLLHDHGLTGRSTARLERDIEDYLLQGTTTLTAERGALLGGMVSGAVGGLAADLLAGGLTFGGGLVAGAILGALGGAGLSRAFELARLRGEPAVRWSPAFLTELTRQTLLRYLTVAHFGRGRGEFRDPEHPSHWEEAVQAALEPHTAYLTRLWKTASEPTPEARTELAAHLERLMRDLLTQLLEESYPAAKRLLRQA